MIDVIIDVNEAIDDLVATDELSLLEARLVTHVLRGSCVADVEDIDEYEKNEINRACTKLSDYLAREGYGVG